MAVNRFTMDTEAELGLVKRMAIKSGAHDAIICNHWAKGGQGAVQLASAVDKATRDTAAQSFKFLYPLDLPIETKIETIAREIYGAADIAVEPAAREKIERYTKQGFSG